jgi:division protein CdvB (Snf7/Vps24/ESCRT-III family)
MILQVMTVGHVRTTIANTREINTMFYMFKKIAIEEQARKPMEEATKLAEDFASWAG